jgi:uncharacterized delta-60 repeat protein
MTTQAEQRWSFAQTFLTPQKRRIGLTGYVLFFVIAFTFFWQIVQAADGDLDLTFGNGGKVVTDIGGREWMSRIAVQPDGKIVAIGESSAPSDFPKFALARYNPDGSLDATFGNGGKVITVIAAVREYAHGLVLLPDGKIMICGSIDQPNESDTSFALLRYNSDGSLDTTFGQGGLVKTNINNDDDRAYALARQSDGKIVAAGKRGIQFYPTEQRKGNVALVRYNPDGSLDATFGNGGIVVNDFGQGLESYAMDVIIQPNGRIIIAGESAYAFLVARYNSNGTLDTTFGNGGFTEINFGNLSWDHGRDAVLQADGKIIVVGIAEINSPYDSFAVARFNPDGSLDQTFGNGGKFVMIDVGDLEGAALQSDGKLIALGDDSESFQLLRFNVNGSLDSTFGSGGIVTTMFGGSAAASRDLVFQPDGKLLAAGVTSSDIYYNHGDFALARYLITSVARPTQFDFDGDSKADISVFRSGTWHLNRSTAGYSAFQFGLSSDQIVPADFDGDGKTDIAVFRPADGDWYCYNSGNNAYSIVHFGANGDVPVPADYDADGRADYAVYRGGTWYIQRSTAGLLITQFGLSADKPVPGDYDGDGKTDITVFREGTWYVQKSTGGTNIIQFGLSGDMPVACDYDGDGKTDIAVWRPSNGVWHYLQSSDGVYRSYQFGLTGDMPAPADYNGDGKADIAINRGGGEWWIRQSQNYLVQHFGMAGDTPVPSAYIR